MYQRGINSNVGNNWRVRDDDVSTIIEECSHRLKEESPHADKLYAHGMVEHLLVHVPREWTQMFDCGEVMLEVNVADHPKERMD